MPTYQVEINLTVAGIGNVAGKNKTITRKVEADDIMGAMSAAVRDITMVEVVSVNKMPDPDPNLDVAVADAAAGVV